MDWCVSGFCLFVCFCLTLVGFGVYGLLLCCFCFGLLLFAFVLVLVGLF